jgi:lysophospholipase L1-like esterase
MGNYPRGYFDPPDPYVTAPAGWDACWKAAKAASGSTPAWMVAIGDSIAQGCNASNWMATSWYQLVRSKLLGAYPLMADFWLSTHDAAIAAGSFNGTPPFVSQATARQQGTGWCYGAIYYWNAAVAGTMTVFTSPYACTDMDIVYYDKTAGTYTYQVDGAAAQTITCTAAGQYNRIQLTGLSNAVHTITFGAQSAGNVMLLAGVATYRNRVGGLGFGLLSTYGLQLYAWSYSGDGPADLFLQMQGKNTAATGFGFPTQPSLAVIELGINDCANAQTTANFQDWLRRMIQALRRGQPNCSIVILAPCNPDATNSEVTTNNWANSANWITFLDVLQRTAAYFNCAFINMHAKWGEMPVSQGFCTASQPHPSDAGHADIAAVLQGLL